MKLPFSLPLSKKEEKHYFLAMLLRENRVAAVIFEELGGKVHVVGQHEEFFTTSLDKADEEELLDVFDKAISKAENSLPPNIETQKTIFGVPQEWVQDARIKKSYLLKLKKLCDALGLDPIGFLVITEAVTHLLQKEEGVPLSALLVEVAVNDLAITLVKAGRVVETQKAHLEDNPNIAEASDILLQHFTSEILPARIILISGIESSLGKDQKYEVLVQEFTKHTWSKSLPFLHVPQITTLPLGFDARAVLFGAATQMGFEVLDSDIPQMERQPKEHAQDFVKEITASEEEITLTSDDSFGFVKDKDIALLTETGENKEVEERLPIIHHTGDKHVPHHESSDHQPAEYAQATHLGYSGQKHHKKSFLANSHITSILRVFGRIKESFSSFIPTNMGSNKKFYFIPPALVVFAIGLIALYIFQLKADVTLHVRPEAVEKTQDITFAIAGDSHFDTHVIAAKTVEIDENATATTDATGKKEIGGKAKGTITIISSLTKETTVASGTTITSSNGLAFLLDKDVKIASSSGLTDLKNAQAAVTAKNIGKEYNLPSGTKFSVESFDKSSVEAKNDSAFSGGSKQEVTVVGKADIDKLLKELPEQTNEKAQKAIQENVGGGEVIVPTFIDTTVSKQDFDKKAGDEAKTVTLSGTVTYTGLSYQKEDMEKYAKKLFDDNLKDRKITDGFSFELLDIQTSKDGKKVTAQLVAKASLTPHITSSDIANQIAGKSFDSARTIVSRLPQVDDVTVTLRPNLSFLPKVLPRRANNITVIIKNE